MQGHAGFAADAAQLKAWLRRWIAAGWPARMAVPTATSADGARWGLGLQEALQGPGRFGLLLERVPPGVGGVHVLVHSRPDPPVPVPVPEGTAGAATGWWFHTGFTGPLLCVRPADGCCVVLLCHRLDPDGGLLGAEALHARRWALLAGLVDRLGG